MTATIKEFVNQAKNLSLDERYELIDALVALDEPPEGELVGEAFLAELKRRSEEIDRGEVQCIPWKEVQARMNAKYGMPSDD